MRPERAKQLLRSGKPFRVALSGIVRGYKIAIMIKYNARKQIASLEYINHPPSPVRRTPLWMLEEFNGDWHPQDVKFMKQLEGKPRRTKFNNRRRRTR
jgi:hypothetical protein